MPKKQTRTFNNPLKKTKPVNRTEPSTAPKKTAAEKKSEKAAETRSRSKAAPKTQAELNVLLNELVKEKRKMNMIPKGAKVGTVRTYNMKVTFEYGDRVDHPEFGTGVVQVIQPKKIEVAFPEGNRVLLHGMGTPENDEQL